METHLDGALDNEPVIGFQGALVGILEMLLEGLPSLGVVVDVLEEGTDELESSFQPKQGVGRKVIHVYIQNDEVLQILVLQDVRTIGFV